MVVYGWRRIWQCGGIGFGIAVARRPGSRPKRSRGRRPGRERKTEPCLGRSHLHHWEKGGVGLDTNSCLGEQNKKTHDTNEHTHPNNYRWTCGRNGQTTATQQQRSRKYLAEWRTSKSRLVRPSFSAILFSYPASFLFLAVKRLTRGKPMPSWSTLRPARSRQMSILDSLAIALWCSHLLVLNSN